MSVTERLQALGHQFRYELRTNPHIRATVWDLGIFFTAFTGMAVTRNVPNVDPGLWTLPMIGSQGALIWHLVEGQVYDRKRVGGAFDDVHLFLNSELDAQERWGFIDGFKLLTQQRLAGYTRAQVIREMNFTSEMEEPTAIGKIATHFRQVIQREIGDGLARQGFYRGLKGIVEIAKYKEVDLDELLARIDLNPIITSNLLSHRTNAQARLETAGYEEKAKRS